MEGRNRQERRADFTIFFGRKCGKIKRGTRIFSEILGKTEKRGLTGKAAYAIVRERDGISGLFFMLKFSGGKKNQRIQKEQAEGNDMRTRITLACTECKQRNYNTTKDKKTHPDRMEIKKYCRFCRTHTLHKETK